MKYIELINRRKPREKYFLQDNGTIKVNIYSEDIHFYKNGRMEEIDNSLFETKNCFKNKKNSYLVKFDKRKNFNILDLNKDSYYLRIDLKNKKSVNLKKQTKNNLTFKEILNGVDIDYQLTSNKIKESIIIKNKNVNINDIVFTINTNFELKLKEDNKIEVVKDNKIYFIIETPYMVDGNNDICRNVKYELIKNKKNYTLKTILDEAWLRDKKRKFPILVDPTIVNYSTENNVMDTYIFPNDANVDKNIQNILKAGVENVNGVNQINRTLLKFDLPELGTGNQVIDAKIRLIGYHESNTYEEKPIMEVRRLTSPFDENTATWDNMSDKYDRSRIDSTFYADRSILIYNTITPVTCYADITDLVKRWYTDTENYGIMLKQNDETHVYDFVPAFYSKNNNYEDFNPKPLLEITYRNQNGLLNYLSYSSQSYSYGSSHINTYNGNLTNIFSIGRTIGGKLPVGLKIVYNTHDVVLNNNIGYGLGYRLSLHQTIKEVTIDTFKYLEYVDEDGTIHYFFGEKQTTEGTITKTNTYYDEDGLDMTITEYNDKYIMQDKNNNQMIFNKINSVGYLKEIIDASSNKIVITYNDNNVINKIKDANDMEINIIYENNRITIASPDDNVILNYVNNQITNMVARLGTIVYTYNENNIISSITDINGRKNCYEYYNKSPYKVKKVTEYGIQNEEGKSVEFNYKFSSTTIKDNKNKIMTSTFNKQGIPESVTCLDNNFTLKNAYGKYQSYGETKEYKNKLGIDEIPIKHVNNYLTNILFEKEDIIFAGSDINLSIVNLENGNKALKAIASNNGRKITTSKNVAKGNYYTFSTYLKNDINVKLSLSYTNTNNELVEVFSNKIFANDDFIRYDVTIFYDSDATSDLNININLLEAGSIYINKIQLEDGEVANDFNYLENSNFQCGLDNWVLEESAENIELITLNDGIKALKVHMEPSKTITFGRMINEHGFAGEQFTLSFWYKNEGVQADGLGIGNTIYNNIIEGFGYTEDNGGYDPPISKPLLPNNDEWQFFSTGVEALYDYETFGFSFLQIMNANDFYVTNFALYKNLASNSLDYDAKGNVISRKGYNKEITTYNYDNDNQLIKMTDSKGKQVSFEYDNIITNRVLNSMSPTGISNRMTYDNYGNVLTTRISNYNDSIINGNYLIRLKGTNKYLNYNYVNDSLYFKEDKCSNSTWDINPNNDNYQIKLSLLDNKYISSINNTLCVASFQDNNSLFNFVKNNNNSYSIKINNKYITVNENNITLSDYVENDYKQQFYLENTSNNLFIEQSATYTESGKYIKSTTDSLYNKTLYDIDEQTGLTKSITNALDVKTNYTYNDKKKLVKVESNGKEVNYTYNDKNMISKINTTNKEYNFTYDEFLNIKNIKIGEKITLITNNYEEKNGNLTSSIYGNNKVVSYTYDELDRIKSTIKMNDIFYYKYDGNGYLTKIISNDNVIKYTYDKYKRLNQYINDNLIIKYNYDKNNNITYRKDYLDELNNNNFYTYNSEDMLIKTKINNNEINYNYDYLGRLISKNINNNYQVYYKYVTNGSNTSNLIKEIDNNNDLFSYVYDKLNNINKIYKNNNLINEYIYDSFNQLIEEKNYLRNEYVKYKYDDYGNILSKKILDLKTNSLKIKNNYTYSNTNWMDQLTEYNNNVITYDNIGNPLTIGDNIVLSWINGRQLNNYSDLNNNIVYKYNDANIRTSKKINDIETKYYLEGKKIIFEKTSNNVLYYMYDEVDDLVGFIYNGETYYYVKNIQNDIIGIIDSNYNKIVNYEYDSWGNIISIKDNNGNDIIDNNHIGNINPFRYRSYYYDKETNLYYLNSRYYNPVWGRFINADGALNANKDILGHNLYCYVGNNVINNIDKNGMLSFKNKLGIAIGCFITATITTLAIATGHPIIAVSAIVAAPVICATSVGLIGDLKLSSKMLVKSCVNGGSNVGKNIKDTIEEKTKKNAQLMNHIKECVRESNGREFVGCSGSGDFGKGNDPDLALSIGKYDYSISGKKNDEGKWNIDVSIGDTYDFKFMLPTSITGMVNDAAYIYQELGIIIPYKWDVSYTVEGWKE